MLEAVTSTKWYVDLDWYARNKRSLAALARAYLCSKCRRKLGDGEPAQEKLITTIRDCCAKGSQFINPGQPVMENVFRLLLANGNQPMSLEEIGQQLKERLGGDNYRTSPQMLACLLARDNFYGIKPVTD